MAIMFKLLGKLFAYSNSCNKSEITRGTAPPALVGLKNLKKALNCGNDPLYRHQCKIVLSSNIYQCCIK